MAIIYDISKEYINKESYKELLTRLYPIVKELIKESFINPLAIKEIIKRIKATYTKDNIV